jgi:hypothetical protein
MFSMAGRLSERWVLAGTDVARTGDAPQGVARAIVDRTAAPTPIGYHLQAYRLHAGMSRNIIGMRNQYRLAATRSGAREPRDDMGFHPLWSKPPSLLKHSGKRRQLAPQL